MAYRSDDDFTVLVVCTGNICRSPAIERLLRSAFRPGSGIAVHSAGTGPIEGEPIPEPMAKLLSGDGVDAYGFAARRIAETMVEGADLILTATRRHRGDVVELAPGAVRRTFTLREFARLVAEVNPADLERAAGADARPAERLAALVPLASAHRVHVDAELDDIADPFRQSDEVYAATYAQLRDAVRTVARAALGVGVR